MSNNQDRGVPNTVGGYRLADGLRRVSLQDNSEQYEKGTTAPNQRPALPIYQPPKRHGTVPTPTGRPIQPPPQVPAQRRGPGFAPRQAHPRVSKGTATFNPPAQQLDLLSAPVPTATPQYHTHDQHKPATQKPAIQKPATTTKKPYQQQRRRRPGPRANTGVRPGKDEHEGEKKTFGITVDREEMQRDAEKFGLTIGLKHSRWAPKEMQEEAKKEIEAQKQKEAEKLKEPEKSELLIEL